MNKKITIKDIAKEANVSVATVSYVLNNRTDQRISPDTWKKVMQIANFRNYTPKKASNTLAKKNTKNVAIYLPTDATVLKRSEHLLFLFALSRYLKAKNYNLMIQTNESIERLDNVDAIICYDISTPLFHTIGNCNFVPLIALDCLISDDVFFQITSDYGLIKQHADNYFKHEPYALVCLTPSNAELRTSMLHIFSQIYFVSELADLTKIPQRNLLIIEQTLYDALSSSKHNIIYQPVHTNSFFNTLYECMMHAIDRTPSHKHFYKI